MITILHTIFMQSVFDTHRYKPFFTKKTSDTNIKPKLTYCILHAPAVSNEHNFSFLGYLLKRVKEMALFSEF